MSKKPLFCNHRDGFGPVMDTTGWVVGELCRWCQKFEPRKDLPPYEERIRRNEEFKKGVEALHGKN